MKMRMFWERKIGSNQLASQGHVHRSNVRPVIHT